MARPQLPVLSVGVSRWEHAAVSSACARVDRFRDIDEGAPALVHQGARTFIGTLRQFAKTLGRAMATITECTSTKMVAAWKGDTLKT
jgi:hypothetical protein